MVLFIVFALGKTVYGQEISKELSDFNEVKVFNGVEVVLIPDRENRIVVSGEGMEKVKFALVENRLEIRLSLENIWSEEDTQIQVYFRTLQVIDANENSRIQVNGELLGANLVFRAQEGASITAKIDAIKQNSKAVTGGQVYLQGKAKSQEIEINTGGQFYGRNLLTQETRVSITAGGKAEVNAEGYCNASAKLGGTIYIYGNPEEMDQKTSLGGSILEMN